MRTVLGCAGARLLDRVCTHTPMIRQGIGVQGLVTDPATCSAIEVTVSILLAAGRQDSC